MFTTAVHCCCCCSSHNIVYCCCTCCFGFAGKGTEGCGCVDIGYILCVHFVFCCSCSFRFSVCLLVGLSYSKYISHQPHGWICIFVMFRVVLFCSLPALFPLPFFMFCVLLHPSCFMRMHYMCATCRCTHGKDTAFTE